MDSIPPLYIPSPTKKSTGDFIPDISTLIKVFKVAVVSDVQEQKNLCFKAILLACENREWSKVDEAGKALLGLRSEQGRTVFSELVNDSRTLIIKEVIIKNLHNQLASHNFLEDLHTAVRNGDFQLVRNLLEIIGIDNKDAEGKTPLHVAIETGQEDMVEALIKLGASLDTCYAYSDLISLPSWALAIQCGRRECFDILATNKNVWNDPVKGVGNLLHLAIKFNQVDLLSHLLTQYHEQTIHLLNQKNIDGYTPLLYAAFLSDVESLSLLESKGACLTSTDENGYSALHIAAMQGCRRTIKLLIHLNPELMHAISSKGKRAADVAKDPTISDCIHNKEKAKGFLQHYSPHNLLFIGGKWNDYLGALQSLQLSEVRRVGGTYGGASIATLIAFNEDSFAEMTKDELEALISKKTGFSHCTFGQLNKLIKKGQPFKHLHLFSIEHHFSSEDTTWNDLIISDTVFLEHRGNRSSDECCPVTPLPMDYCPIGAFDFKRYIDNSSSMDPNYNHRTLALTIGVKEENDKRILKIQAGEAGKQTVRRFFDTIESNDKNLFLIPLRRDLIAFRGLNMPLESFVGREEELKHLKKHLLPNSTWHPTDPVRFCAIVGPPGQGKSQLACYFANKHIKEFSLIYWINSETDEMQLQAFRNLAKDLKIITDEKDSLETTRQAVFEALEEPRFTKPWLLVFDNLEKSISYPQRVGCVLFTMRSQDTLEDKKKALMLLPLKEKEVLLLAKNKLGDTDAPAIRLLMNEFEGFPLILNNALAYMVENSITTIQEYLNDLKDDRKILFHDPKIKNYSRPILTSWSLTFEKLKKNYPFAFKWLQLCAYLNPVNIPLAWITHSLKRVKNGDREYKKIVTALTDYGLIQLDQESQTFSLHHLTQQVIQAIENTSAAFLYTVDLLLEEGKELDRENPKTWEKIKAWIPQATSVATNLLFESIKPAKQGNLFNILGISTSIYSYREALKYHQKALEIRQKEYKAPHPDIAVSLNNVGTSLHRLGNTLEGEYFFNQSVLMQKELFTATYDHSSSIPSPILRFDNSSQFCQNPIDATSRAPIENSQPYENPIDSTSSIELPSVFTGSHVTSHQSLSDSNFQFKLPTDLNEIGWGLLLTGQNERALNHFKKALNNQIQMHGDKPHSNTVTIATNIGNALLRLGKNEEALTHFKNALEVQQELQGNLPYPFVALIENSIGCALNRLNKAQEAKAHFEKALAIQEQLYGQKSHPHTAVVLNNIGTSLINCGEDQQGLKYCLDALLMQRSLHDEGPHPAMAFSYKNMGHAFLSLDRKEEALTHFQNALKIQKEIYGQNPSQTVALTLNDIGEIQAELGKQEEALKSFEEAWGILLQLNFAADHPYIKLVQENIHNLESWCSIM